MSRRQKLMSLAIAAVFATACSESDLTGIDQGRTLGTAEQIKKDEGEPTPVDKCAVYRNELCDFD
ncbi:MAG: hypothetical protein ACT443_11165 [Gemmatimonadota bacterium]